MLDSIHIRLLTCAFLRRLEPSRWCLPATQSSFWRLYMNDTEGATVEHSGISYPLEKGRLYFIPAGVRFSTHLEQPVGHFYVHFDLSGLPYLVRHEIFTKPIALPAMEKVESMVWEIIQELTNGESIEIVQQFRVKATLYEAFLYYFSLLPEEQVRRVVQEHEQLAQVLPALHYIEARLAEPLSNNDLAKCCYMNTDYFIRRFRTCVGQTPNSYIQSQRVKRAERCLLLTQQSIDQIAVESGFSNRSYFTRVFTRHVGVSPAAYRKGLCGD